MSISISMKAGTDIRAYMRQAGIPENKMRIEVNAFTALNPNALNLDYTLKRSGRHLFPDRFEMQSPSLDEPGERPVGDRPSTATSTTLGTLGRHSVDKPLPKDMEWYGPPGITPAFLSTDNFLETLFDFAGDASNSGTAGTGYHLGGGYIVTAYHVVRHELRQGQHPAAPFVGDGPASWNDRWAVKAMPGRGSYGLDSWGDLAPTDAGDGTFNDFTLVHAPEKAGKSGAPRIRRTSDLKAGERLFVVGDRTDGTTHIASGTFEGDDASALPGTARILGCGLELGFSGSPVLDEEGLFVGVIFATNNKTSTFVRSETLLPLLEQAKGLPGFPSLVVS